MDWAFFSEEQAREDPPDDRACLEALLPRRVRLVPVGERHAVRRRVRKRIHEIDDAKELVVGGDGSNPHLPVGLGERGARIERKAVCVGLAKVVLDVAVNGPTREDVEAEHFVEQHVVLERPRARLVVLEARVVAVVRERHPALRIVHSRSKVVVVRLRAPRSDEKHRVSAKPNDALCGQVDVVRRGTLEVVRAQLVAGVGKAADEIVAPCLQDAPVAVEEVRLVALGRRNRRKHEQHVGCLLHGHLLLLVRLNVADGPLAEVVRRPGEIVRNGRFVVGVVHQRLEHEVERIRGVLDKEGRRRVHDVHRANVPVAADLLHEDERLVALGTPNDNSCAGGLPMYSALI
eukprot:Opistho-1_new@38630